MTSMELEMTCSSCSWPETLSLITPASQKCGDLEVTFFIIFSTKSQVSMESGFPLFSCPPFFNLSILLGC